MNFYNRNGVLYIRVNGKRVSTKLDDTPQNRKLIKSYHKNDEFFKKFNVSKTTPTVLELCEEVLNEKSIALKTTSFIAYNSLYNSRIVPYFDKKKVTDIKAKHIEEWYKTFTDKQTIITCEAILKPAFEKAIVREFISSTPFLIKKPNLKSEYLIQPFNLLEIQKLIQNAPPRLKNIIAVMFYSGMRIGELIALRWSDIDFKRGLISINKTRNKGVEQPPKTKSSIRDIDMLSQCETYLLDQKKITGLGDYVFLGSNFRPYNSSDSLNYSWNVLLRKINLEKRGIYQLRHSFASNMLSNGEDTLWVSAMMGHKSPTTTLTKYYKFIKRKRERKTTFLDEFGTKSTHIG